MDPAAPLILDLSAGARYTSIASGSFLCVCIILPSTFLFGQACSPGAVVTAHLGRIKIDFLLRYKF